MLQRFDHFNVVADDGGIAAISFLTEVLGVPRVDSMSALWLGSGAYIEFLTPGVALPVEHPARAIGIAFRPDGAIDDEFLATLDACGVRYVAPENLPDVGVTRLMFRGLLGSRGVGAVQYHDAEGAACIESDADAAFTSSANILGVAEVIFGVTDLARKRPRWDALLGQTPSEDTDTWRLSPGGPLLRLVEHDTDDLVDVVVAVRSADVASQFAARRSEADPLDGLPISCRVT